MITYLSSEAVEYGRTARRALDAAGGDALAGSLAGTAAGSTAGEPDGATAAVAKVLDDLGAWDLDPRGSGDELEAAAALCRSAGWWAVPHPVAERLARPRDVEADALVVVAGSGGAPGAIGSTVAGLDLRWVAVDLDGRRSRATPRTSAPAAPAGKPGVSTPLDLEPLDEGGAGGDVDLGLVLPCWTLLGMLDRAIDLTSGYVRDRHQFGQPLASFQGVQFQLTDAEVERAGLDELAKHALWSVGTGQPDARADALALRLAAIEAAEVVFRITHQLHGAIGFCDETALSWVSRASQPLRRLPFGPSATRAALTHHVGRRGLTGLFS
jgi:3-oxo-4-pregnene-20-carboxyl-CoA dehydrogenase alpha subunit